jgi:serine/threonine-protein kinase
VTRYELLDRIGVGGMAEIFRGKAVAAGGFEKPVAIKRILPHLSQDRRFVELLIAEAKVLSLLKHRNIVQIFDVGLGDDGKYFLVMEYVDGKDMGAVQRALEQKRRRIPFDLVLHIGAEICEALEHAHVSRGPDGRPMSLVHRDVSPSNVLFSRAGEIKLTDFGIAKRAEQDATQGGAVRGKFAYISPEQARNEHLDPRSDVFSVGILMWELLCNRRLFSQLPDLEALRMVREAQIQSPTQVDNRLPPEIDPLLMTALSRDKLRRYPTAGAFGAKLRSLRYSLDTTVGDPATELAKIIESTEQVERESRDVMPAPVSGRFDFDASEATVIRINTAAEFSARDDESSIVAARSVIDRFEEEETRLASLTGDQMRMLRSAAPRDSSEMTAEAMPSLRAQREPVPGPRSLKPRTRAPSDEATRARSPLEDEPPTMMPRKAFGDAFDTPEPNQRLTPNEDTKIVAPRSLRTPAPQRTNASGVSRSEPRSQRPPTQPPPLPGMPPRANPPTPAPPSLNTTLPGGPAPGSPAIAMQQQPAPFSQQPPPNAYAWGPPIAAQLPQRDATPTTQDSFDRPMYPPQRPSMPQVAGFSPQQRQLRYGLKPWMLIVGAIVVALAAFAITRAFIR